MASNSRPLQFRDYLPLVFRADAVDDVSFLSRFLKAFETLFEELETAIEGTPGGLLRLAVQNVASTTITVEQFRSGSVGFPLGTIVTALHRPLRTTLTQAIPPNSTGLTHLEVQDTAFGAALQPGDVLHVHPGGIPDVFHPDTTPPPQFTHRPQADCEYLRYLASWIALPLRAEKPISFNRAFFQAATPLYRKRGTLSGIDALLRAWLRGDLEEKARLILTDLTRVYNDVDTIFQLAPEHPQDSQPDEVYAQLGVNTVLGEGPPFFFLVDLLTNPAVRELRHPAGLDAFQRAARFLLDAEKPAHTYYQLRVRAHTIQLTPERDAYKQPGEIYAQVGETTLLWDEPWVFDSDC